ncbi:hypothetical protein FNV43_RR11997 [Rhamnella rubrinervis]|uniref:Uncharacterized protein n=1 Tax=Rhamnella rubrinervis TaxID=2594499 RepID=A0A8K0H6Q1_9ROSA|nr:hypothetical protein FNV43_RR11997 [Rhamnella rubrinervis]
MATLLISLYTRSSKLGFGSSRTSLLPGFTNSSSAFVAKPCVTFVVPNRSPPGYTDKPLPASALIDRAGEARRGWMSERLKESVLKTEVLIGIPEVRIPLHPRSHKFSLALSIDKNESDRLD